LFRPRPGFVLSMKHARKISAALILMGFMTCLALYVWQLLVVVGMIVFIVSVGALTYWLTYWALETLFGKA